MWKVWDLSPDRYASREQMEINQLSNLLFFVLWVYAVATLLTTTPFVSKFIPPTVAEAFYAFVMCTSMPVFVLATPHYAGRVMGFDTELYLETRQLNDTFVLLGLDTIITATHLVLPLRYHLMVLVQISGVLSYALPATILGSPHPENVPHTIVLFLMLIALAGSGTHSQEREERKHFMALILEKSLRFQSEFQLAAYKERRKGHADDPHSDALSTSKASTKRFELDSVGLSFEALVDLGLREQWLIREQEVHLLRAGPLGEGGFGVVVRGRYHGAQVAVKAPKKISSGGAKNQKDGFLEASCNELRILRRLRHPNIVVLYGAVLNAAKSGVRLCLVLELIKGESLRRFIARAGQRDELSLPSSEAQRVKVLTQIVAALCYLHSREPVVVHGDLKDTNIFVDYQGDRSIHTKLLDFGLSRLVKKSARAMGGTLRWAAPEVLSGFHAPATATDVFSLGRIVFYVSTGLAPFSHVPDRQLRKHVLRAAGMQWPPGREEDLPGLCRPLAEECTRPKAELRPRASIIYPIVAGMGKQGRDDSSEAPSTATAPSLAPSTETPASLEVFDGFDFASDGNLTTTMSISQKQLPAVPEGDLLPKARRLVHSTYRPTPHDTLMKAVGFLLMQSNHEVGADGACCWVHAGVQRLKAVCRDMQEMPCDGWEVPVEGQCKDCNLLYIGGADQSPPVCGFCQGEVQVRRSSGCSNACSSGLDEGLSHD